MRIAICTATRGFPRWRHVVARDGLIIHTLTTPVQVDGAPTKLELRSFMAESARVDDLRTALVGEAFKMKADWILWLDDDQTFPPDTLFRLLKHGLPVVGCNIRMRAHPTEQISAAFNVVDGERRRLPPRAEGLEKVEYLGLAVALTKIEIFRQIPQPWFVMGPHDQDGHLCELLRARGISPVVDHGLSREVGHLAEVDLKWEI